MSETYQFTWGEVIIIKAGIALADTIGDVVEYGHFETKDYDLDTDKVGMRIRIPHDRQLDEERKAL